MCTLLKIGDTYPITTTQKTAKPNLCIGSETCVIRQRKRQMSFLRPSPEITLKQQQQKLIKICSMNCKLRRQQKQTTGIMHIYTRKRRETWKDTGLEGNIDKTSEHRNGHVTANL